MSIQSNINNTIGQAAILASLSPNIQEMGETARDKSKIKSVEKQLDVLKEKADKNKYSGGDKSRLGVETQAVRFPVRTVRRWTVLPAMRHVMWQKI